MRLERVIVAFGITAALFSAAVPVVGQGGGPAGNRAEVSRPWPPDHLPDGQPDVQGIWSALNGGAPSLANSIDGPADFGRRGTGADPGAPKRIIDPPHGQTPYQPWAAARQKQQANDSDRQTK